MAVNQMEEAEGPLEAEDVGPDPYNDDEADDTVAIKGDYKKQFSAERTTNQWVMLGIKSGGLSIGLLSAGQYEPEIKMAGTLLLIPSIFCALWGGLQYRRRTNNIEALSKDSLASFEDRFGTTVAVASLSLAVCVNAAFSLMRYFDNV